MEPPAPKPRHTILVVDDLEDNRDLLSQWLERHGYRVVCAENCPEALERLSMEPIDLVLLDINMPQVDGFEFLKLLRADERLRSTPVICMTAHFDEPAHLAQGLSYASGYFTKPFSFRDLLAKIEVVLQTRRPIPAADRPPRPPLPKPSETS